MVQKNLRIISNPDTIMVSDVIVFVVYIISLPFNINKRVKIDETFNNVQKYERN